MLGRVDLNNECGDIVATDFFSAYIDIFMHKNLEKLTQYHSTRGVVGAKNLQRRE